MDSNARAFPFPQDPAYVDFMAAGYQDAWLEVFPAIPGLTSCQAELGNNPISQLPSRIDLILTLGDIQAQNTAIFGADPSSMTPGGLWPSTTEESRHSWWCERRKRQLLTACAPGLIRIAVRILGEFSEPAVRTCQGYSPSTASRRRPDSRI